MGGYLESSRRKFLQSIGIGLAATGAIGSQITVDNVGAQENSEPWTQYGFDARNTGYAPDYTPPVEHLQTKWTFGNPRETSTFTNLSVIDDTAFVLYTRRDFDADPTELESAALVAVDTETGEEIWRFDVDDYPDRSAPIVSEDNVYFGTGSGNLDPDPSRLYAVDRETGEEEWHYEIDGNIITAPKVVDDTVYFASHMEDSGIYALDAEGGSERWMYETGNNFATPAITDDAIYYVRNGVHAISRKDQSEIWSQSEPNAQGSSPVVKDDTIFVGSRTALREDPEDDDTAGIYALDQGSGEIKWHFETNGDVQSSPAVADNLVVAGVRSPDETIYAIDIESGDEEWSFELGDVRFQSPIIIGNVSYVGNREGIHALDLRTGEHLSAYTEDGPVHSLAVSEGIIYFGSSTGTVRAVKGETGNDDTDEDDVEDGDGDEGDIGDEDDTEDGDEDNIPGFGVGGAAATLGGAAYLLTRRLQTHRAAADDDRDQR